MITDDISSMHMLHRPHVFELLSSTFHFSMPLDAMTVIEIKKQFLLAMIHLIHCGHITPGDYSFTNAIHVADCCLMCLVVCQWW
jgi:hypothetical protein